MKTLEHADDEMTLVAELQGARLLRTALAMVYLWFGALKLRNGSSEAEELAGSTIKRLTLGHVSIQQGAFGIGLIECAIGLGLLTPRSSGLALRLIPLHLLGASSPLVVFPKRCFRMPWLPTMEGQYILKNAVLGAAAFELVSRSNRTNQDKMP